jgi:hypothetical protein
MRKSANDLRTILVFEYVSLCPCVIASDFSGGKNVVHHQVSNRTLNLKAYKVLRNFRNT